MTNLWLNRQKILKAISALVIFLSFFIIPKLVDAYGGDPITCFQQYDCDDPNCNATLTCLDNQPGKFVFCEPAATCGLTDACDGTQVVPTYRCGYGPLCDCIAYGQGWHDAPFWEGCDEWNEETAWNGGCWPGEAYAWCDGCYWNTDWSSHRCYAVNPYICNTGDRVCNGDTVQKCDDEGSTIRCEWLNVKNCDDRDNCYPYLSGCEEQDWGCISGSCQVVGTNDRATDSCGPYQNYCSGTQVWKHQWCTDYYCEGSSCNGHDSWINDQYVGTCDDGNPCTSDSCSGAGICSNTPFGNCSPPGATQSQACGLCGTGTQTRTCTSSCTWGSWGTCSDPAVCSPGATQSQACGNCGTQSRTCNSSCAWGSWGACTGEGVCSPGATQSCGNCGIQTCTSSCSWGACSGEGVCSPGATGSQACGNCGTQSRTCNSSCAWGSWGACTGELSTTLSANPSSGNSPLNNVILTADPSGSSGTINYTFYCNRSDTGTNITSPYSHKLDATNTDPYSAPSTTCNSVYNTPGSYTAKVIVERGSCAAEDRVDITVTGACTPGQTQSQACGNCGTQIRTCGSDGNWGAWGSCSGEGVCSPGATGSQACGLCGTGTQTRTCTSSCTWGSWGTCSDPAVCSPGATQSCGNCGIQTCTSSCSWGACSGEGVCVPNSTQSQACGLCGTQIRTCQSNCTWGTWGVCIEGICSPGATQSQACGNCGTQTRTCQSNCSWGTWGACTGEGACSPGATQSQACGNCGTQTRTCGSDCNWGTWGACTGELSTNLTANPLSGNAPLNDVDLTADVSGTSTGTINYTFYCNRSDAGTNITAGYDFKIDNRNPDGTGGTVIYQGSATSWSGGTIFSVNDVCDYSSPGTYTAKVIVERSSCATEDRVDITASVVNNPPTATNLNRTEPDCCADNPAYFFSWTYTDQDNDTQSRFDFQIDNNSDFSSSEVNRSFTNLSNPSPSSNNQVVQLVVSSTPDKIIYNTTYYWRVKVYDSYGLASGWVNGSSFTTPVHHYPKFPDPDFTWLPYRPSPDEQIQFDSSGSTCYDNNPNGSPCINVLNGGNDTFYWDFINPPTPDGDATPAESSETNPQTKFRTKGAKPVTLTITDGSGYSCTAPLNVLVRLPLPKWREVKP